MKILILQNGWSGQGISGGDKHLIDVATDWKSKHQLTVLLPEVGKNFLLKNFGPEIGGIYLKGSWEIWPFGVLKSLPRILLAYFLRTSGTFWQLALSGERFELALSSSHFFYDLFPLLVLKLKSRTKLIVYVYHLLNFQGRPHGLRNYISLFSEYLSLYLIKHFADLIFTDNRETQEQLLRFGLEANKIQLIGIGIRRSTLGRNVEKKYGLCFLGRLVKSKGTADLVEVFSILKAKNPSLNLVVVGRGDEETTLKEIFRQRDLSSSVAFLGAVDEETKYRVLSSSRVFVSPSLEEGWGMALGEALACGLPAVVYDLPVLREIYKTAPVFVTPRNATAMATEVEKLLSQEDYYREKVEEGLRIVSDYYLEVLSSKELSWIENL